ncbi:transposase, partial [Secundilactobacillus oryzae JCM 18671]
MRLVYRKKMLENRHFLIGIFQYFTTVAYSIKGQLHFICINGDGDHEIVQILPDRFKNHIEYFRKFPQSVRDRVKTVSIDLNSYYKDIAKQMFPN